ncbi:hypothetical protein VNO78_17938 [Psophocarpus tetragonolobus]|uniref:MADS-box domain-containing protein n=1 Tax=Psophocarpus tetragonolobus TaxID=3891 RepID=A0AAN9XLD6_PSOTE
MPRRKKLAVKLIENLAARKACYKKRRASLLKKVEDLTILCGLDACAIIHGPGDNVPTVWPSHDKAQDLLHNFENDPLSDRLSENVTPRLYIEQKNKEIENQLAKLKEKNNEKDMSNFMHQIHHDGKSLSDFDESHICRLLCYVEAKLQKVRAKLSPSAQHLTPTPPASPLHNDIDNSPNFGGLIDQSGLVSSVLPQPNFTANTHSGLFYGSSSSGGGSDMYSNFGGTIGASDMMFPFSNNSQGTINGNFMGLGQHAENQGTSINNIGLWGHQSNFGANNNDVGRSSISSFIGTNNGGNSNLGFPSPGNFASSGQGSDIEWPTFAGVCSWN